MSVDLSVEFCGIRFKNPFIVSGSPGTNPRIEPYRDKEPYKTAAKAGWAGSIMKIAVPTSDYVKFDGYAHNMWLPREIKHIDVARRPTMFFGIQNICVMVEGLTKDIVPVGMEESIKQAKKEVKGFEPYPIGLDVGGRGITQEWVTIAKAAEKAGADFITLDLSCPGPEEGGVFIGLIPEKVMEITKAVKQACRVPVVPKLSASAPTGLLRKIAKAAEGAGADGLICTDSVGGFIGVDVETSEPIGLYEDVNGKWRGVVTGITGPALRPVAMRCVAETFHTVKIPISACGGISSWDHAVEYIMLGAKNVEACTAPMTYGYKIVREWIKGLEDFMKRKGYKTIEDFRGITAKKYMIGLPWTDPKPRQPAKMVVDEELCTGCGVCVPACEFSAVRAMRVVDFKANIDQDRCIQCNMCMNVCPQGAISRVLTR